MVLPQGGSGQRGYEWVWDTQQARHRAERGPYQARGPFPGGVWGACGRVAALGAHGPWLGQQN